MQTRKSDFLFDRNTLLHLRLPFSFFLLPVFIFGISESSTPNYWNILIIFIVLHFLIYPGSNIYNSFMDEDKGSIGGLKNPPPVTKKLYYVSMILDAAGLLLCLLVNVKLVLLIAVYIGVSKAYSWKKIRLKKYAFTGWLVVMLFQGGYTFLLVNMSAENNFHAAWLTEKNIWCMLLASLLIGAYYPLTQIYQHDEDSSRGDQTISYRLGIMGTFIFSGVLFMIASVVAWLHFVFYYNMQHCLVFFLCLTPAIAYYFFWLSKTFRNRSFADYDHAMRMTFISSCSMIICFSVLLYLNHWGK